MHMQKGPQKNKSIKGHKIGPITLNLKILFFFISTLFYNSVTLFNYWYLVKIPVIGAALTRSSPPRAVSGRSKAWGIFPRLYVSVCYWSGDVGGEPYWEGCISRIVLTVPFLGLPVA
jgi:hypothetical protein